MTTAKARRYHSRIALLRPNEEALETEIEVNRPLRVGAWWIYQKGYDPSASPKERRSQFEVVRDPWLPVLYAGLGLMAIGSLLGFGRAAGILRPLTRTPSS